MTEEMTVKEAAGYIGVSRQRMHVFVKTERVKATRGYPRFTLLDAESVKRLKAELDSADHAKHRRKNK